MSVVWNKANPDDAVDRLPQPYRMINKVIEAVLDEVGSKIDTIVKKRQQDEYEYSLKQVTATTSMPIDGRITCMHVEPRASSRFAVGTSKGELLVIDAKTHTVLAQRNPFPEGEAVHRIALASDGDYQARPKQEEEQQDALKPKAVPKIAVAGEATPSIQVFGIQTTMYGCDLQLECTIRVKVKRPEPQAPEPEQPAGKKGKAKVEEAPPVESEFKPIELPIKQLEARGTDGGCWVFALLYDRSVNVFLCPLGKPMQSKPDPTAIAAIIEEKDNEEEGAGEFGKDEVGIQIETPTYRFQLPSLAPMAELPEPELGNVRLSVLSTRSAGSGPTALRVPTYCFISSPEANKIVAYSVLPPPPLVADQSLDADALLKQLVPALGDEFCPATSTCALEPHRKWMFPAKTTAVASSPSCRLFAVGCAQGFLALVNVAAGPSVQTTLPGHYAAVASISFYKGDVLISVGADAWVHHYDLNTHTLKFRCLFSSPPAPAPAIDVKASTVTPLAVALNSEGWLRLFDLRNGRKIAYLVTPKNEEEDAKEQRQSGLLGTAAGFILVTETEVKAPGIDDTTDQLNAGAQETEPVKETATAEDDPEKQPLAEYTSKLFFFDHQSFLCSLFPGIAESIANGTSAANLFASLQPSSMYGVDDTIKPVATMVNPGGVQKGSGQRDTLNASPASLAKLTEENLKRVSDGGRFGSKSLASASLYGVKDPTRAGVPASGVNWQLSVRRQLRRMVADKDMRQIHSQKRVDALRRQAEGT